MKHKINDVQTTVVLYLHKDVINGHQQQRELATFNWSYFVYYNICDRCDETVKIWPGIQHTSNFSIMETKLITRKKVRNVDSEFILCTEAQTDEDWINIVFVIVDDGGVY